MNMIQRQTLPAQFPTHMKWPKWPWLPIKRHTITGGIQCALLHADDYDGETTPVYLDNLYSDTVSFFPRPDCPVVRYVSLEAMFADGWMVD